MATATNNYGASQTITISPASLATSSTFIVGREGNLIDNTSTKHLDIILSGKLTVGTTPTTNTQINVYGYALVDDTPTYPDQMTGTDAARSVTSAGILAGILKLCASLNVDSTTSDRSYYFEGVSLAAIFGGTLPPKIGIYVAHNTGVNLNATAGNHFLKYQGVKVDIA